MPVVEYDDVKVNIDDDGYLLDMDEWNEKVANALAVREGVGELTKERLAIIRFLRDYYKEYNYFPILNAVCLNVHLPNECMKQQFIEPLKAWKIAGLPKPNDIVLTYLTSGMVPT
jgi:TusE/DsrC/DsvC family sulfur relay protein